MNKVIALIALITTLTFSGIAIADTTTGQLKKEIVAAENIQKGKQSNDKKKAEVNAKKIKKTSACCEPDPIKPGSVKSAGKDR
jgi:hypothetical protein